MITEAQDTPANETPDQPTPETETRTECIELDPETSTGQVMMLMSKISDAVRKKAIYHQGRADGLETALKISHHWNETEPMPCQCDECRAEPENEKTSSRVPLYVLAQELHEAGRKAVENGNTVAAEKFGEQTRTFIEWDDLTDTAKQGRLIQARYLIDKYDIMPK